ncbi:hypothetical protein MTO96_020002 [Rhipicephalus appendiculatus]
MRPARVRLEGCQWFAGTSSAAVEASTEATNGGSCDTRRHGSGDRIDASGDDFGGGGYLGAAVTSVRAPAAHTAENSQPECMVVDRGPAGFL